MDADILKELITLKPKTYFILTFSLSTARVNEEIKIQGDVIFVDDMTLNAVATIRLNEFNNDALSLKLGKTITASFYRFFLTNTAQSGCSISLIIAASKEKFLVSSSTPAQLQINWPTHCSIYNVPCTLAATEYSQALPSNCLKFSVKARGGVLWVCMTASASGTTYILLADGQSWSEDNINLIASTLYFQSPATGCIAEIIGWN